MMSRRASSRSAGKSDSGNCAGPDEGRIEWSTSIFVNSGRTADNKEWQTSSATDANAQPMYGSK